MSGMSIQQRMEAQQGTQARQGAEGMLHEQLEHDESGTLRDRLLDELVVAVLDIEAVLGPKTDAIQGEVLRNLLRAVELSERVVQEVWESFHGSPALIPRAHTYPNAASD